MKKTVKEIKNELEQKVEMVYNQNKSNYELNMGSPSYSYKMGILSDMFEKEEENMTKDKSKAYDELANEYSAMLSWD